MGEKRKWLARVRDDCNRTVRLRERIDPYYTYGIHYIPVPRHCVVMLVAATADWYARSRKNLTSGDPKMGLSAPGDGLYPFLAVLSGLSS